MSKSDKASTWKSLVAGGAAGAVSRTATAPLERAKILAQITQGDKPVYNGVWDALKRMPQEHPLAYFKGNGTNVIRIAPYSAILFYSNENYREFFRGQTADGDLSTMHMLVCGAMAGITASTATYPLDLVRARLTAQTTEQYYTGIWSTIKAVVKQDGFIALYQGIRPTLAGIAPYNGINFAVYEFLKDRFLQGVDRTQEPVGFLLCGAASGATAQTVTYPFDLIRRRMQVQGMPGRTETYTSIADCARKVVAKKGIPGLYQGMVACYLKVVPAMAVSFMTYELMKQVLHIS